MTAGGFFRAEHYTGNDLQLNSSHLYFTSLGFLHTENVSQQSFLLKVWSFPPTFVSAFLSPSTSLSFPNSASKEEECWPLSRRDGLLREHMVRGVLGSRQRGLSVPIRFNRFQALGLVGYWTSSFISVLTCMLRVVLALTFLELFWWLNKTARVKHLAECWAQQIQAVMMSPSHQNGALVDVAEE